MIEDFTKVYNWFPITVNLIHFMTIQYVTWLYDISLHTIHNYGGEVSKSINEIESTKNK